MLHLLSASRAIPPPPPQDYAAHVHDMEVDVLPRLAGMRPVGARGAALGLPIEGVPGRTGMRGFVSA